MIYCGSNVMGYLVNISPRPNSLSAVIHPLSGLAVSGFTVGWVRCKCGFTQPSARVPDLVDEGDIWCDGCQKFRAVFSVMEKKPRMMIGRFRR